MAAMASLLPACHSGVSLSSSSRHVSLPSVCHVAVRWQSRRSRHADVIRASADVDQETTTSLPTGPLDASNPALAEQFAVVDTGRYECRSCGYVYDQTQGDPDYPLAPGTEFKNLPEDWRCPTCGAAQNLFQSKSKEVAGFAQNQTYGLGGNSLTSGQKSILIYGSLAFFFALFLSGYFLE